MKKLSSFHSHLDPGIFGMALLRFCSALIELSAAFAMLYVNDIKKALAINSLLAIIGPIIFITATTIGLVNIAGAVSYGKLFLICLGVLLILIGILK